MLQWVSKSINFEFSSTILCSYQQFKYILSHTAFTGHQLSARCYKIFFNHETLERPTLLITVTPKKPVKVILPNNYRVDGIRNVTEVCIPCTRRSNLKLAQDETTYGRACSRNLMREIDWVLRFYPGFEVIRHSKISF